MLHHRFSSIAAGLHGRWRSLFAACCAALLLCPQALAAPCSLGADSPWLTLAVTASEIRGTADRSLRVQVADHGCVAVHRPVFLRGAGDYLLQLGSTELSTLRQQLSTARLEQYDEAELLQQLRAAQNLRSAERSSGSAERFQVLDGDRYQLELRTGGKTVLINWTGLHEYAEFYPEVSALKVLSKAIQQIEDLAASDDAQRVSP